MKYCVPLFVLLFPITGLRDSPSSLENAALERTQHQVRYDGSYVSIAYSGGDVPADTGVCTDVIIRSYRQLGHYLQVLVHEDISRNFTDYSVNRIRGQTKPDKNFDHRRLPILRTFFSRHGESIKPSNDPASFLPGDLITWNLPGNLPHIGIVLSNPRQLLTIH